MTEERPKGPPPANFPAGWWTAEEYAEIDKNQGSRRMVPHWYWIAPLGVAVFLGAMLATGGL